MNTTASSYLEHVQSRRSSIETIYSIQGNETDIVRDTSDTEWYSEGEDGEGVEYEPETETEGEERGPISEESSGQTDNEIISTEVLEVRVKDDGVVLADTEQTGSSSDSELDLHDYWLCAHCRADNNNPRYRYCEKCFKLRKNFFPPRPKRKRKYKIKDEIKSESNSQPYLTQDSGIEIGSQTSQSSQNYESDNINMPDLPENDILRQSQSQMARSLLKRRAESFDVESKRTRTNFSDPENSDFKDKKCETEVSLLVKTVSDPGLTVETSTDNKGNAVASTHLCMTCESEEKSAVFVHGRIAHICCCYKCALKVWARTKRCPLCNRKVSNVLQVK